MIPKFTLRVSPGGMYFLFNDRDIWTPTRLTPGSIVANMNYISSAYFKTYEEEDTEILDNSTAIATFSTYDELITKCPELLL